MSEEQRWFEVNSDDAWMIREALLLMMDWIEGRPLGKAQDKYMDWLHRFEIASDLLARMKTKPSNDLADLK